MATAPALSLAFAEAERASSPIADKLSDLVYEQILARIASAEFAPNSRLPTEHQLADSFRVSRPVVREALARLRDEGVVASRRGSGTYVRRAPSSAALRLAPVASIADMQRCFEFRIGLEGEMALLAARSAPSARAALTAALATLEAAVKRGELAVHEDFAFHAAIAAATGNRFYQGVMSSMSESIEAGMTVTRSLSLMRPKPSLLAVHAEHVAIYDAIMADDGERARVAARTHLENARRRVFEGTELPS